jgi:hypothetical protein
MTMRSDWLPSASMIAPVNKADAVSFPGLGTADLLPVHLLIAANPDADSSFPYLLRPCPAGITACWLVVGWSLRSSGNPCPT